MRLIKQDTFKRLFCRFVKSSYNKGPFIAIREDSSYENPSDEGATGQGLDLNLVLIYSTCPTCQHHRYIA